MSKLVRITDLKWVNYFWLGETAIFGIIHNTTKLIILTTVSNY